MYRPDTRYNKENLLVILDRQDTEYMPLKKFDLYNHYTYRPDTYYIPKVQNLWNTDQTDTAYNLVRMYLQDNK